MNYRIAILICSLVLCIGCGHRHDERLQKVAEIVSDKPEEALSRLDSINPDELSSRDRVYYDFLTVKGRDKAFITHTSDSLIKIVLDYAEQHKDAGFYTEVLYYGGRVYSDLGDYPTALRYFQSALDRLPPDASNITLRRNVLNQTVRLLDDLRLFKEAVPLMEQTLAINRSRKDTTAIVYDLQLLGHIYMRDYKYSQAEPYLREAFRISKNLSTPFRAKSAMLLAGLKYYMGDLDSALLLVRHTPDSVTPIARHLALAYAADIYRVSGISDTAYIYAFELINGKDSTNRERGYKVMLSPQLKHRLSTEIRDRYIDEYRKYIENYYNENENRLALNQESFYNYQLHDRDKLKAEKLSREGQYFLAGSILVILVLIIMNLQIKNKNKIRIIELHKALDNIEKLKKELDRQKKYALSKDNVVESDVTSFEAEQVWDINVLNSQPMNDEQKLRERLKTEILTIYNRSKGQIEVSPIILQSCAYATLQERIMQKSVIQDNDSLWIDLENVVKECSPKFKENLNLLTSGKLSIHDLHTSLLIKCGLQPSQMASLFGRSRAAIVSRRDYLCIKIFDKKMGTKVIDAIIRLL